VTRLLAVCALSGAPPKSPLRVSELDPEFTVNTAGAAIADAESRTTTIVTTFPEWRIRSSRDATKR
jgi:hypothetical protein